MLATVTDAKLTRVTGDPDNPMFKGYTCPKGRALPEIHNNPARLLHSQKRQPDGTYAPIESQRAMDEIAARLQDLIDRHGPRSVAMYLGTNGLPYPASPLMANAFLRGIESPMFFTANTIDQPGKQIALAAHDHWLGGDINFNEADSWMLVGTNPIVPEVGTPGPDGMRYLGGGQVEFPAGNRSNTVQVAVLKLSADDAKAAAVDLARKIGPKIPA